jgi:hypothetical protein
MHGAIIYCDDKKTPSVYLYMGTTKLYDRCGIKTYVYLLAEQAEEVRVTEHSKWCTEAVGIQHPITEVHGIKRIVTNAEHVPAEFESMVIEYAKRRNVPLFYKAENGTWQRNIEASTMGC